MFYFIAIRMLSTGFCLLLDKRAKIGPFLLQPACPWSLAPITHMVFKVLRAKMDLIPFGIEKVF